MPKGSYIAGASGSVDLVALSHLTFCWSTFLHNFLWSYLLLLIIVIGLLYLFFSFLDRWFSSTLWNGLGSLWRVILLDSRALSYNFPVVARTAVSDQARRLSVTLLLSRCRLSSILDLGGFPSLE